MIVAEQKPIEQILSYIKNYNNIAVAACGTCVTVCMEGGEKEANELTGRLKLADMKDGRQREYTVLCAKRQCDSEFLAELDDAVNACDAVLSLGCGAGVQFVAERYIGKPVLPALNTRFIGVNRDVGYWTEMCQGCGDCVLEMTGGVCPVARCSKSNFNGPCGGSSNGKCEINGETDCAWQLIYDRLKALGQLDRLNDIIPPRDWRSSRDGGPRSQTKKEVRL